MWYRFALTEIEPDSGQLVLPGMKSGKFDLSKLRFEVEAKNAQNSKDIMYDISVFVPSYKDKIGQLAFTYEQKNNFIFIWMVEVFDIQYTLPDAFTISDEEFEKLKEEDYEDYVIKNTGKGIVTMLYKKMLEIIQNDPVLSQADYIVGNNNSTQALKATDKVFGKPEMAGKGYSFAGSKIKLINLEKQKKDLEENIKTLSPEDQLKTQQEINNINDQISNLREELSNTAIDVDNIYDLLRPSADGVPGSYLGGKPVDTFHRIPQRVQQNTIPENQKPRRIYENPTQQRFNL